MTFMQDNMTHRLGGFGESIHWTSFQADTRGWAMIQRIWLTRQEWQLGHQRRWIIQHFFVGDVLEYSSGAVEIEFYYPNPEKGGGGGGTNQTPKEQKLAQERNSAQGVGSETSPVQMDNVDFRPKTWFGRVWQKIGGTVHTALEVAGMLPVVGEAFDAINGIIHLAEGNYDLATVSFAATIPVFGNAVTGAKWAGKGVQLLEKNGFKIIDSRTLKEAYSDLVEQATKLKGGNVTVQRDGKDLFRVHQPASGHGFEVTQFRNNFTPDGKVFRNPQEVRVRRKHLKQLERALKGDPRYNLRTLKGK